MSTTDSIDSSFVIKQEEPYDDYDYTESPQLGTIAVNL